LWSQPFKIIFKFSLFCVSFSLYFSSHLIFSSHQVFNSVPLEYLTPQAFLSDLNSLPAEWTLVQISRKPQCQEILQGVREHMTGQIDCRLDEARLVVMSSGEMPIQVLVDKPLGKCRLSQLEHITCLQAHSIFQGPRFT
jgi:hypothetical protein